MSDILNDIDILARTIYGEARGEGTEGMEAVACVVMNRYQARKWFTGYEIKDGIKIPNIAATCLKRMQFSCWNKNDPNWEKIRQIDVSSAVFLKCLQIAQRAISGKLQDFTNGAVYYHAKNIKPKWALNKSPCYAVKNHLFYR